MRSHLRIAFFAIMLLPLLSCSAQGQLQYEQAFPALTFTRPVDLQYPGDGSDRLFVVEQPGRIEVFTNDPAVSTKKVFLDITDRVNDSGNEEGLLGLAFHPEYQNNGYFFVDYTAANPRRTVIARYRVSQSDLNAADKNSELILLEISQPYSNHNGGQVAFGPDGYLYIGMGDGGDAGDPQGNGQNLKTLLGAILRIDVDNPAAGKNYGIPADNPFAGNTEGDREEIFAYGLRNPWRFSFDKETGTLWAGDVGQNRIEEVDIIEKGKNYGWNIMEGSECYNPPSECNQTGLVFPVWVYFHGAELGNSLSITGGYVYRGSSVPELSGRYIYADFENGRIWALTYDGANQNVNTEIADTPLLIAAFGVDKESELYFCAFDGKIYRFKATATGIGSAAVPPQTPQLAQNFPNPFNPSTTIGYTVHENARVKIDIFDLAGQRIARLLEAWRAPGTYRLQWDGRDDQGALQPSGTYLYRLQIGERVVESKRMLLVK